MTSKGRRGGRRYQPYAFTEQGVAMLSSVLRSERAVEVNIAIMRAFVKLRQILETNRELAKKFSELEQRVGKHDDEIDAILEAIRQFRREVGPENVLYLHVTLVPFLEAARRRSRYGNDAARTGPWGCDGAGLRRRRGSPRAGAASPR